MSKPRLIRPLGDVPEHLRCSLKTAYNYVEKRYFPVYEIAGRRGVFVDLNEVDAAMALLPPSKAKAGKRRFGGAPIIMLPAQPEVVGRESK